MPIRSALFMAVSGASVAVATTASADVAPSASPSTAYSVAEVVVTAQKRTQNLQNVPVSVSAVTAKTLVTSRIRNIDDLNAVVPNLTVRASGGGSHLPSLSMRGINAAVVGLLAAALYVPVWTSAVTGPRDFGLALVSFVLLTVWETPPLIVVVISALGGIALGQ